jgi:hypothetical protein
VNSTIKLSCNVKPEFRSYVPGGAALAQGKGRGGTIVRPPVYGGKENNPWFQGRVSELLWGC